MKKVEEMKDMVRRSFKEDAYSELLGFLEVENTVLDTDYPEDYTTKGAVLVYYRAHTGEVVCELLTDMIGVIEEEEEEMKHQ